MVSPSQPHEASRSQRAQILLDRGMAALRRGARGLARNRLVRVVELEPTTANAWIALARAAVSPTDAVSHLRRALELAPESDVARAGLLWHSSMIEETAPSESNGPVATLELPVTQGSEESQPAGEPAVELAVPESIVASAELTEFETRSVQTTIVAPPADESLMFEVGGASELPVASTESPEVHATEEKITPVVGLPTISSEEATATVVVPTETVPDVATVPSDMSIEATVADADIALEGVPSVAAPPVSEQELATDEWQRWLTGRQRTTAAPVPTNVAGPAIVNEVSERLAHALQRVLGARAGLSLRTASDEPVPVAATPDLVEVVAPSEPEVVAPTTEVGERAISIETAFDDVSSETPSGEPADDRPAVLVVDDSPTIRRVVADALRPRGYRVFEAADGIQGIREIATVRPDLILMDITMPRLDGYRLCRLVKGHANTRSIPVVMLSGKDGTFDRLRGRLAGCSDYISKPFSNADLLDKVARHLAAKKPVAAR